MPVQTGTVIDHTMRSRALLKHMRVRTYLPPGYNERGRYPLVMLLHPWGADERYWTDTLCFHEVADHLINAEAVPPFIAAMPQGDKSFFINAAEPDGNFDAVLRGDPQHFDGALEGCGDYGDYLLEDVLPLLEGTYSLRVERRARVLAGVAMGATGAGVLAFSQPKVFGTVAMHSPVLYDGPGMGPPWIFGLWDERAFTARDPLHLAARLPTDTRLRIYLDCGLSDDNCDAAADLHYTLIERLVAHRFHTPQGDGSAAYWRKHLGEYIGFYAAGW